MAALETALSTARRGEKIWALPFLPPLRLPVPPSVTYQQQLTSESI